MITFNILSVTSFPSLLEKILEWRKQYGHKRIRFDTPYLRDPLQYDINILPKEDFMPYMMKSLEFMEKNIDEKNDKFSVVEYEKFKRVVDYMKNTNYAESKIIEGRKDFYNWFNALDSRRDTKFLEIFPELEEFYYGCKSLLSH
jgi:hypothetical protein